MTIIAITSVFAGSGWSEITNCTPITALPATISTQGIYCLQGHLSTAITSGDAIEITANNVTLDLNGWKLGGQAAGTGTLARGIYSAANNVTVRNGIVRGFSLGVYLTGRGARVEDLLVDQNTTKGIQVEGQGAVVRRNQIIDTGGSTGMINVTAAPIYSNGADGVIEDNIVSGLVATGDGGETAIYLYSDAHRTTVRRNIVSDDARPPSLIASSSGIAVLSTNAVVVGNNVINFDYGIYYVGGASGTYAQNVVVSCDTPYSGGTPGSDND
jgi:hypothetical protein